MRALTCFERQETPNKTIYNLVVKGNNRKLGRIIATDTESGLFTEYRVESNNCPMNLDKEIDFSDALTAIRAEFNIIHDYIELYWHESRDYLFLSVKGKEITLETIIKGEDVETTKNIVLSKYSLIP